MHSKNQTFFFFFSILLSLGLSAQNATTKQFFFGKKTNTTGTSINNVNKYTDAIGYGFDYDTAEKIAFKKNYLKAEGSVYFSVKLPEGNYKIEVVLGGKPCSTTTIKAESRRLMLQELALDKKETSTQTFTVNVRTPKINEDRSIKVKSRDKHQLNWDNKLTLEFLGTPVIQSIKIEPADVTTVFLAGDSTVTDQDVEPWASWGQFITNYFNDNIAIANYAESGSSLPAFKGALRLEKILSVMKPNDYLIVEFGHNDEKIKGEGNGAWGLYSNLLKEYITAFRDQGGKVILSTPTERRHFDSDGNLKRTHGDFPAAMKKVAEELNVPLIDLTEKTRLMYQSWGVNDSKYAFVHYPENTFPNQTKKLEDNTHFNGFGANEIAKAVATGIQGLNLDLSKYLKTSLLNYNPKHPNKFKDWTLPMSTRFEITKPDGN
ncbi:rhamnogalacturonan acetylesterase [Tamlana nanhaiensis]|uniref:Rhamnogalacturonan acetylesterase n=1 Tax=Neotamlana nanhaiensis TaxID=1382798 RepID=A0A0D7W6K3_9FLAO|nr:rhamnogalacturonan acetylesterase [Tamlana nanhaiensis]KJD34745.1 rhamnogalacturonan acetylesterase [Tamlana nanhaiensis]